MDKEIKSLHKKIRVQTFALVVLAIVSALLYFNLNNKIYNKNILKTKGLIIEDNDGKPRIAMGFPVSNKFRKRKDTLSGIVFLDEKGMDRIHLGKHGKLYLGGQYLDRLNEGYSLFFNDSIGEERSGYGFSDDDNSVGLGMDYGGEHGGEAIYLYAVPKIAFMTINADLQNSKGIRDRIVLWHETDKDVSILKLSDSKRDGRIILKAEKGENPKLEYVDSLSIKKSFKK